MPQDLDDLGKAILTNPTDYKMCLARYHLLKIQDDVPLNFDKNHFVLEYNVESFLFYANLGIENIAFNINSQFNDIVPRAKYSIQTLEYHTGSIKNITTVSGDGRWYDRLTIYSVRKALDPSIDEQKIVSDIIDNYFSKPEEINSNQYDFTKSSLWVLRELRNYIAHNPILGRHLVRGSGDITSFLLRVNYIYYEKEEPSRHQEEVIGTKLAMIENNPKAYFSKLYQSFITFVDELCEVKPQICPTFYYKTLEDPKLHSLLS